MESPKEKINAKKLSSEKPEKTNNQETKVFRKYGKEDVYGPEVEESIQTLKEIFKNREILLTDLQQAKASHDLETVKRISRSLENIQRLLDEFLPELKANIDIELLHLQSLHEQLDPNLETKH